MSGEPIRAVVVSPDRLLLRRLCKLLESLGCQSVAWTSADAGAEVLLASPTDLLLIDTALAADRFEAICTAIQNEEDACPPALIALVARHNSEAISQALAAGADDILHKPLCQGEVFARVRAALRLREQYWRQYLQAGNSETFGCLPAPAWRALASEMARRQTGTGACVAVTFDHLQQFTAHLRPSIEAQLRAAAMERLLAASGDDAVWGQLDRHCFAALLPSCDDVEALSWCERLKNALAQRPFEIEGTSLSLTASIGVSSLGTNESVAEERARGAMHLAANSGGDTIISAGEWQIESRRASDEPSWLDSANAWDVMIPHPLALFPEDTVDQAATLFAQTQLGHMPVVDGSGKLVGLLSARSIQSPERKTNPRGSRSVRFVRVVMQSAPARFEEDTPVRKLQQFFAQDPSRVVVVTRQGRPLGLVYADSLASLGEPLSRSTFAPHQPFSLDSSYLTTPEVCAVEE